MRNPCLVFLFSWRFLQDMLLFYFYRVESVLNIGVGIKALSPCSDYIFLLFLDLSFMHKDFNIHTLQKSLSYWTIKRANKTDIPEGNVFSRLKTLLDSFSENNYSAIFHYYHNTKNWFLQLYLLQRFTGPCCTTSFFDKTILAKMF